MTGVVHPLFGRYDIDRAAEHRGDAAWLAEAWSSGEVLVVTERGEAPIVEGTDRPELQWRATADYADVPVRVLLGLHGGRARWAVPGRRDIKADSWSDLRMVGEQVAEDDASFFVEAVAIVNWHASHTRCPRCGESTVINQAGWSRRCPADDSEHFPRTDPAVIMLVHDGGDRCVLGRQSVWPEGRFSVLAGFVEPGETSEQAVAREVAEEVGLKVTDIHYVGSQPWPFPASLMLGFVARVDGDQQITRADGEIAEANWFSRYDIRERNGVKLLPTGVSIAYHILKGWLDGELS